MLIDEVIVPSPFPGRLGRWYATLGFAVSDADGRAVLVQVGRSRLRLVPGPSLTGSHHLAYSVPGSLIEAVQEQVGGHADLVERGGATRFHFDPPFGPADSIYCLDPDGSLIEFIGRERSHPSNGFDATRDVVGIAEVAVPVDSVPVAVKDLLEVRGLAAVLNGPEFAAVGDHDGMLIIVSASRTWFPTDGLAPETTPLTISLDGSGSRYIFSNGTVLT